MKRHNLTLVETPYPNEVKEGLIYVDFDAKTGKISKLQKREGGKLNTILSSEILGSTAASVVQEAYQTLEQTGLYPLLLNKYSELVAAALPNVEGKTVLEISGGNDHRKLSEIVLANKVIYDGENKPPFGGTDWNTKQLYASEIESTPSDKIAKPSYVNRAAYPAFFLTNGGTITIKFKDSNNYGNKSAVYNLPYGIKISDNATIIVDCELLGAPVTPEGSSWNGVEFFLEGGGALLCLEYIDGNDPLKLAPSNLELIYKGDIQYDASAYGNSAYSVRLTRFPKSAVNLTIKAKEFSENNKLKFPYRVIIGGDKLEPSRLNVFQGTIDSDVLLECCPRDLCGVKGIKAPLLLNPNPYLDSYIILGFSDVGMFAITELYIYNFSDIIYCRKNTEREGKEYDEDYAYIKFPFPWLKGFKETVIENSVDLTETDEYLAVMVSDITYAYLTEEDLQQAAAKGYIITTEYNVNNIMIGDFDE